MNAAEGAWNEKFEFEELAGEEYLKVKCYKEEMLGTDNIGTATLSLHGISNSEMHIWVPLEEVSSGEIELLIEAVSPEYSEVSVLERKANVTLFSLFTLFPLFPLFFLNDVLSFNRRRILVKA